MNSDLDCLPGLWADEINKCINKQGQIGCGGVKKTTPADFAAPLCIFAALFGYPAELATLITYRSNQQT